MRKAGIALTTIVLAGAFVVPVGGTESLVRKAVADRSFEAFLPPANFDVPWLTIDKRTKLPKGDSPSAGTQTLDR